MSVRLSLLALRDIEEIRTFTVGHWSRDQWLGYFAGLSAAFDRIGNEPACGRPRDLLRVGMRSLTFQKHLIFFEVGKDGRVAILRIIHERRNFAALSYNDDLEA